MPNAYIHRFKQNQQYFSFYPYYLPAFYSNYYPRHYNRYYEPVSHVTLQKGPMHVQDTTVDVFNLSNLVKLVLIVFLFMFMAKALFR